MRKANFNPLLRKTTAIAAIAATCGVAGFIPGIAHADDAATAAGTAAAGAATPENVKQILVGKKVFLDPGHQGTNITEDLAKQVPDGRGGTKDCQTTGATSVNGVPEHTINWKVANLVKASIEDLGGTVELSRADDDGWGGCIDERAKKASDSGADLAVSIHADSTPAAVAEKDHGFHLIVPTLPVPDKTVNEVQSTKGILATKIMRESYVKAGFAESNYAGTGGLMSRSDIAGPALTKVPLVFVEMGNLSNTADAGMLESEEGELRHAVAIITGIVGYLLDRDPRTGEPIKSVTQLDSPAPDKTPAVVKPEGESTAAAAATTTTTKPAVPTTAASAPATAESTTSTTTSSPTAQELTPAGSGANSDSVTNTSPATLGQDSTTMKNLSNIFKPLLDVLGLGSVAPLTDQQTFGLVTNLAASMLDSKFKTGNVFPLAPDNVVDGETVPNSIAVGEPNPAAGTN
ncbi:N-acetylmuramoyl-L-alanine amidase [Smaragdicoccus niigatensis]|uniref:N-acetylmuramoyl-L-alanine amidase n=1 Tax=Smaragdicoccus niigatensis TaxID=359359 RepID=UPI000371D2F3|nr:N-acetylmuramoyl-L-alanine amidase [Smaragdicoccus niigatensis]